MYKQVITDKSFIWDTSGRCIGKPIATLADEYGGRAQIVIDDGCYLLMIRRPNGRYIQTAWIFHEAHEVLRKLPTLSKYPRASKIR